jgi:hypothetical protein
MITKQTDITSFLKNNDKPTLQKSISPTPSPPLLNKKRKGGNTGIQNSCKSLNTLVLLSRDSEKDPSLNWREFVQDSNFKIPKLLQNHSPAQVFTVWEQIKNTPGRVKCDLGMKRCDTLHAEGEKVLDYGSKVEYTKVSIGYSDLKYDSIQRAPQYSSHHIVWLADIHIRWFNGDESAKDRFKKYLQIGTKMNGLHIVHNCGNKACCKLVHLDIQSHDWNKTQQHCHFFIQQMISKYGVKYRNTSDFQTFQNLFCPHNKCCI